MGINKFQQYLKNTYCTAYKERWLDTYDNLYIDLNYVLYHICYVSSSKEDILLRTKDYLLGIIRYTKPKKRIIIVSDGTAPLAKLMLQRKRRLDKIDVYSDTIFDETKHFTLHFTPGTEFMMTLRENLIDFETYIKETYNLNVIISITEPDEGEIKIRKILQNIQNAELSDTHIVYSGDSDMILLLFTCHKLTNIYQTPKNNEIISLNELYNEHIHKFGKTDSTKYDFVFINLLMGNDYIPKVLYITFEKIWTTYAEISRYFTGGLISYNYNSIKLDPIFLHDLLYITSKKIAKGYLNRFKIGDLKNRYYKNYVDGLYWCFSMYITGNCFDYSYIYNYNITPHISGVILSLIAYNRYTMIETEPFDSGLYSILLIPNKANSILSDNNKQIAHMIEQKYPIIYEEECCRDCKQYIQSLLTLNNNRKNILDKTNEKDKASRDIKLCSDRYKQHKKTHNKLNYDIINEIYRYYTTCKTIIIDNKSKEKNGNNVYIPPNIRNKNKYKKRLF